MLTFHRISDFCIFGLLLPLLMQNETIAQMGPVVELHVSEFSYHKSFKLWPQIPGQGVFAQYRYSKYPDGRDVGEISYQYSRKFSFTVLGYNSNIREPELGETFVVGNTFVKVKELSKSYTHATAFVEILDNEYSKAAMEKIDKGFFLCEKGAMHDRVSYGKGFRLLTISKSKSDPKQLDIIINHSDFDEERTFKIGDELSMSYCPLRITAAEPADEKAKRRGWIVVEPDFSKRVAPQK